MVDTSDSPKKKEVSTILPFSLKERENARPQRLPFLPLSVSLPSRSCQRLPLQTHITPRSRMRRARNDAPLQVDE